MKEKTVEVFLRVEYASLLILSVFLYATLGLSWWWYPLLVLFPDIGMAGYLINPKFGAVTYNTMHSLALGIALLVFGYLLAYPVAELAGILIIGHIGIDRFLGFGLKYQDFRHTHLGRLPRTR